MSKINIRESLKHMDEDTFCRYDLTTMYDSCVLDDEDKKVLAKMLYDKEDPEVIYQKLCMYFDDDQVADIDSYLMDVPVEGKYESLINKCVNKLSESYKDVSYNDVANQLEFNNGEQSYVIGVCPFEDVDTDDYEVFIDYNYDSPCCFNSEEEALKYILNFIKNKVNHIDDSDVQNCDDEMVYTVYDIVEDDDNRLVAKCMNESTNDFEDIKLGKTNTNKVIELVNNMLNNPNYKVTKETKDKIYKNSAPWGLAVQMTPSVDVDGTNGLLATGDFSGEASFGESVEESFEKDDRVTDGDRQGTVLDCDSQKVLVEWDYSDTDDIEWVDKSDIYTITSMKESTSMYFTCPSCENKTLVSVDTEVKIPSDVDYHDKFICDECGEEFLSEPQFNGKIKFVYNNLNESIPLYKKEEFKKQLQDELYDKMIKLFYTPDWGFENIKEIDDLINPIIEIEDYKGDYDNDIKVELRAELNYPELEEVGEVLNKVIQKYDKNSYFEPVEGGIADAYLKFPKGLREDFEEDTAEHLMDLIEDEVSGSVIDYYIDNFGKSFIVVYNNNLNNIRNEAINLSDILTKNGYKVRDWNTNGNNVVILRFAKPISLNEDIEDEKNHPYVGKKFQYFEKDSGSNYGKTFTVTRAYDTQDGVTVRYDSEDGHQTITAKPSEYKLLKDSKNVKRKGKLITAINESASDKRLSSTSVKYKGYRISVLTDGSGYAIFDKHGEMEDYGFKSIKDAKDYIDEYNSIYKSALSNESMHESYSRSDLRQANMDAIDYFIEFEDIYTFPKGEFLAHDWEELLDGVAMGMDDDVEIAEGIMEYLQKEIDFNNKHKEIYEDDPQAELTLEIYNKVKREYEKEISKYESISSEAVNEAVNGPKIKITGGSCDTKWIYDTMSDSISMFFAINNIPCEFKFSPNHGRYVVDGVDCDHVKFEGDSYYKDLTHSGGTARSYALSIPSGVLTSQPKQNQKDYRFTGQYYSTTPAIRYCKELLKELLTQHPEYFHDNILDKLGLAQSLEESSYGGAFDIEDDQYFTKEDIMDLADEVCERLYKEVHETFDISDLYMDGNTLHMELESDSCMVETNVKIDMRKIRKPLDIMKYALPITNKLLSQVKDCYNY